MRFFIYFLLLSFSGFLFSCSSASQLFSFSESAGQFTSQPKTERNIAVAAPGNDDNTSYHSSQVLALSESSGAFQITAMQGSGLQSQNFALPEPKTLTEPQQVINPAENKAPKKKISGAAKGPDVDKVKLYGRLALASGILAFAPFVLSMSLLYAIPFAISGLIFGRLALNNRKGNYRQHGVALAKAGFMMSIVISVILFALGLTVLVGT